MKPSIANRISRVQFWTIFVVVLILTSTSYFFAEFLKESLLAQDFEEERIFIMEEYGNKDHFKHKSKSIFVEYVPNNLTDTASTEGIFSNIQTNTRKQLSFNGKKYWVSVQKDHNGTFYHARDLSNLEARENKYFVIDIIITLLVLITAWIISKMTSIRVVEHLSLLTKNVQSVVIDQSIKKVDEDLPDLETASLASSFNTFLSALERFVTRERTMVGLASHELRTPIAVILGAVDVLQKKSISEVQKEKALARIENAADEMNANVTSLLRLSRKQDQNLDVSSFNLEEVAKEVVDDLSSTSGKPVDIEIVLKNKCPMNSDRVLVKLLLRNLLQNSLQHTHSTTKVTIDSNKFIVTDSGEGLPADLKNTLDQQNPDQTLSQSQGLGLYIVTLICERFDWKINLTSDNNTHHYFEIVF